MNILGINMGHDSGAALICGEKIFAVNEERLSRIKMHHGFPFLSIDEVLQNSGLQPEDIDQIAVEGKYIVPQQNIGFDPETHDWKKQLLSISRTEKFFLGTETGLRMTRCFLSFSTRNAHSFIKDYLRKKNFQCRIAFIDHHYCHAAGVYYTQPYEKGLAITLDASGEGYCSRIYTCAHNEMKLVHQIPCYHSPAYYYAYITKILGFKPMQHEGKITGLAAFGKGNETKKIFEKYIFYNEKKMRFENNGGYHLKIMSQLEKDLKIFSKQDIAAGIQEHTEEIVCRYINCIIDKFCFGKPVHVFLAGGLFANVKVNQQILNMEKVSSVYIFPNMGDGGLNLGAALAVCKRRMALEHVYFGKKYSDTDIEKELNQLHLPYRKTENISYEVAKLLAENKVVGRFDGAMEYGPRALGNRSIICSARDKNVNKWLNQRLKRTEFMPFAPYVRDVDYREYFHIGEKDITPFKFMTVTCSVTEKCCNEAPAITHVDGTARPQIIFREQNPSFYDILTEYKKLTGVGVLLNTSFNMHEEPIVNTPREAINAFKQAKLDALAIGNFIVY